VCEFLEACSEAEQNVHDFVSIFPSI